MTYKHTDPVTYILTDLCQESSNLSEMEKPSVPVEMSQITELGSQKFCFPVQESSNLVRLANKTVDVARTRDPLPGLREVVAGLSNDQAHAHFRRTRPVVYSLRDTTINLNAELRALARLRDALQKTQAEVARNLKINSETQQMRQRRPKREKVGTITITITINV